ncbi:MAG: phosphosulfolactate synthase [Rhodospirillaceae bacterium]|nr:phosphosulfolactate synthase [Rhodospirillaceae bacterium]HAA91424.1 phosphosulfolactate synthase [Rhodospirillaceae bacterium]
MSDKATDAPTDERGYYTYERLKTPRRQGKPRKTGVTAMIDVGPSDFGWTGPRGLKDLLDYGADAIDYAKIYAINALDYPPPLIEKIIGIYRDYDVVPFAGGILFETAYHQNAVDELITHLDRIGLGMLEVSENYLELEHDDRLKQIDILQKAGLKVVYEFGRKMPTEPLSIDYLGSLVEEMIGIGVDHVIVEQSEIDMLAEENPQALQALPQQKWFEHCVLEPDPYAFPAQHIQMIEDFGSDVSLCNVTPEQVLKLEGFRRGIGRPVHYSYLSEALK